MYKKTTKQNKLFSTICLHLRKLTKTSRFNPIVLQLTLCDPKSYTAINTRPLLPHTKKIIHIKTQTKPVGGGKKSLDLALLENTRNHCARAAITIICHE